MGGSGRERVSANARSRRAGNLLTRTEYLRAGKNGFPARQKVKLRLKPLLRQIRLVLYIDDFLSEIECFARLKAVLTAYLLYEEEPTVRKT